MKWIDAIKWWHKELEEVNDDLKNLKATRISKKDFTVASYEKLSHSLMRYAKVLGAE